MKVIVFYLVDTWYVNEDEHNTMPCFLQLRICFCWVFSDAFSPCKIPFSAHFRWISCRVRCCCRVAKVVKHSFQLSRRADVGVFFLPSTPFKSSSIIVNRYLVEFYTSITDDLFIFHSSILSPLDKTAI